MITKIFYVCGRPHLAVRVATCSGRNYMNFVNRPQSQSHD